MSIERADFWVKNYLNDDIIVKRKFQDGSTDSETTIAPQELNEEGVMFPLPDLQTKLIIDAPTGWDTKENPIGVKSDVDVSVACSISNANWILKIEPNELEPPVPTTVNVTIGDLPPG